MTPMSKLTIGLGLTLYFLVSLTQPANSTSLQAPAPLVEPSAIEFVLPPVIIGNNGLKYETKALNQALPTDTIVFKIAGFGGDAMAMVQFMSAMASTKATVNCHLTGPSFSAHALITLACNKYADNLRISPFAFIMLHSVQGPKAGKLRTNFNESMRPLMRQVMTDAEITELFSDDQNSKYIQAAELIKLLTRR